MRSLLSRVRAGRARKARALLPASLCLLAAGAELARSRPPAWAQQSPQQPAHASPLAPTSPLVQCAANARVTPATHANTPAVQTVSTRGSAADTGRAFRESAQRGLDYVSHNAVTWQGAHNCYGCHVQAVTLDALMVGRAHQYRVASADFETLVQGMTTVHGGSRNDRDRLFSTAQAFSGSTFARYDAQEGASLRDDLLLMANRLTTHQQEDGRVRSDDTRFPVENGDIQATTQGVQTWRQVYERTADERWLVPMRRAEEWLQTRAAQVANGDGSTLVDVNYAVMGLAAAGAGAQESVNRRLAGLIRTRQNDDGGWGFRPGEGSNAFATGQTLYALRLLGADDNDGPVARGMGWLVEHQGQDGSWSHAGSGNAEAMWSVLGLVSLDMVSVSVVGVRSGQHVAGVLPLRVSAQDNSGQAIRELEVRVDDVAVHRACSGGTEWSLDAARLPAGPHVLEVVATNTQGRASRRRMEIFSGAHYVTEAGTRFVDGSTVVSFRDVAPEGMAHRVRVTVYRVTESNGRTQRAGQVHAQELDGRQGPVRVSWNGRDAQGASLPSGRYLAEVQWLAGAAGTAAHTVELPFVHDTPEAQHANYGEVAGRVALAAAPAPAGAPANQSNGAANATVQLVNERGEVVQTAHTTREGQYRFRNVGTGNYSVRVQRDGFAPAATAPVRAAPAAEAHAADVMLH